MFQEKPASSSKLARRSVLALAARTALGVVGMGAAASVMAPGQAYAMGKRFGHGGGKKGGGKNGGGNGANCLLAGTRIATPRGDVAIEALKIGDEVITADRGPVAIKWIGRQTFRRTSAKWVKGMVPVRISASAMADVLPARDVFASQGHLVLVAGTLVPASSLINGSTVTRADFSDRETIEYFHIELDTHEIVYAEGIAVESFRGSREFFDNFVEYERLYGTEDLAGDAKRPHRALYDTQRALKTLALAVFAPIVGPDPLQAEIQRIFERSERV